MKDNIFIPEHKTNVLPLRWLANYVFHPISMWFFRIGLRANNKFEYDFSEASFFDYIKEKIGFNVYNFLNYPYDWWGTTYIFDRNAINFDELGGVGWDDYDYTGHPYWDYLWHEDPETGDAWRIINKAT
jgi:hypothetical protein